MKLGTTVLAVSLMTAGAAEATEEGTAPLLAGDFEPGPSADLRDLSLAESGLARWTLDGGLRDEICEGRDRCVVRFSGTWELTGEQFILRPFGGRGDPLTFDASVQEQQFVEGEVPSSPDQLVGLFLTRNDRTSVFRKKFRVCRDFNVECPPGTVCRATYQTDRYGLPTVRPSCVYSSARPN